MKTCWELALQKGNDREKMGMKVRLTAGLWLEWLGLRVRWSEFCKLAERERSRTRSHEMK